MKIARMIGVVMLLALAGLTAFIISNTRVLRAKTSAESADLSDAQLAILKQKAIAEHDQTAAARIYWYYRFTKKDFVEAGKWEYAVSPVETTNSSIAHPLKPQL